MEVKTLEGLKRQVELILNKAEVESEVKKELQKVAKSAKIQGFRPGKAPLSMIERNYGGNIRFDIINRKIGEAFDKFASDSDLRIAGLSSIEPADDQSAQDDLKFNALFEVYPEITLPDLSALEITRAKSTVTDDNVKQTIETLRKQRADYNEVDRAVQKDDRLTVDFVGRIDGEEFAGGKADGFVFVAGQGQMLPEFEEAVLGMKKGESKSFDINFPEDYQGKEVAGKTAQFDLTVQKVEEPVLPELDAEFAKSLGQNDGDVDKLVEEIKNNLTREIASRVLNRNKQAVMDALIKSAEFDVPTAMVNNEVGQQLASARENLKARGVPNADTAELPAELFRPEAERRVRLGLLVSEILKQAGLQATDDQIKKRIENVAANYEDPQEVVDYFTKDANRRAEFEALVVEDNVVEHILSKAKVKDEDVDFQDLMR